LKYDAQFIESILAFLSWVMPTEAVPNDIEGLKVSPEMLIKVVGDMNNAIIETEIDEDLDSYRFVFTEEAWSSLLNLSNFVKFFCC